MDLLVKRGEEIRAAMDAVQQSANSETKSTAGDKHETARAMAQLEVEMLSKQLEEVNKSIALLKRIPTITAMAIIGKQPGEKIEWRGQWLEVIAIK